jgi:hypothetical protein
MPCWLAWPNTSRARSDLISALEPHQWGQLIRHAGAIFLGRHTSENLGDYCPRPSQVLPASWSVNALLKRILHDTRFRIRLVLHLCRQIGLRL